MPNLQTRFWFGVLAALCAGAGYGAVLATSKLTYAHGVQPLTLVVLRYVALSVLLGLWLGLRGRFTRVSLGAFGALGFVGLLSYIITVANLNSVRHIPVSLTTLIFYTHPIIVAIVAGAMRRARVGPVEMAATVAALCGLFISLQVSFSSLHPLGILFAGIASLSSVGILLVSDQIMHRIDPIEVAFYMAVTATVLSCASLPLEGGLTLPSTSNGVWLVGFVTIVFMVAITAMFFAIRLIGPMLTSMIMNVEPICAISVAVAFLGEPLPPPLLFGALLVIAAILLMQASQRPAAL